MSRHFCQALCVGVATAFMAGCGGSQPPISAPNTDGISSQSHRADALLPPAKHGTGPSGYISNVIVIIQENRSFENFFAGYPGANAPTYGCGAPSNVGNRRASNGCPLGDEVIPLHEDTFEKEPNLSHLYEAAIIDWNNGRMDGFTHWGQHLHDAAYAYIEPSQVAPYWTMAQQYVLADNMFPTEFGPSWTGHLTLVAGTDSISSDVALADFATGSHSNCKALTGTHTTIVDSERWSSTVPGLTHVWTSSIPWRRCSTPHRSHGSTTPIEGPGRPFGLRLPRSNTSTKAPIGTTTSSYRRRAC